MTPDAACMNLDQHTLAVHESVIAVYIQAYIMLDSELVRGTHQVFNLMSASRDKTPAISG